MPRQIQAFSLAKRRTPWNQKIVYIKVLGAVIPRESSNSEESIVS